MDKAKESIEKSVKDAAKGSMEQVMKSMKGAFEKFCQDGGKESDGKTISLKNIQKWMQQCNLIGGKSSITNQDVENSFSKVSNSKDRVDMNQFEQMMDQLAQDKNMDKQSLLCQLGTQTDSQSITKSAKDAAKGSMEQVMKSMKGAFEKFCQDGGKESDGKSISLKNIQKWMQQCNLIGGKSSITNQDVENSFSKVSNSKDRVDMNQFEQMMDQLAQDKNMDKQSLLCQLGTQTDLQSITERIKSAFGFGTDQKSDNQTPSPGAQMDDMGSMGSGPRNP